MAEKVVTTTLDLSMTEASALAELSKRAGYSDVRSLALDQGEAYAMIGALDKLRRALAASGVLVR